MFGKILSMANLCTALAMCSMFGMAAAMPVRRASSENAVFRRDLVPLSPDSQIEPEMVDLLDQYRHLAEQAAAAKKGTPEFDALVVKLGETKAQLEAQIQGVATFVTEPVPTPTSTTVEMSTSATATTATTSVTSASTSMSVTASTATVTQTATATATEVATTTTASSTSTSSVPTTISSKPSTTTAAPTEAINTNVPVLTIVTQVGTSIVVVASQGVTSTITLATRTAISSSATSSTSSRSTSTFDINTVPAPGTEPTTLSAPGTAVNSSQNNIDSGAASFAPSIWSGSIWIAGLTMGALISL